MQHDREAAKRLLNVPNMHNTGNIHGVLPSHVGMRVRFAIKVNSRLGLVQDFAKPRNYLRFAHPLRPANKLIVPAWELGFLSFCCFRLMPPRSVSGSGGKV